MSIKSDFWNKEWIHIRVRIPPISRAYILMWNPKWKEPMVMKSYEAHQTAVGILNKQWVSEDRFFTHWCFVYPPEKSNRKRRSRRTK